MPFTIVHLLAPAPVGGLESVVRLLATGQQARGHDVVVVPIVTSASHPFVDMMREQGVTVSPIHIGSRAYHRERAAVGKLLADVRPDVVHSHGYQPDILDLPIARRMGIATVTSLHGFIGGDWKLRLYERMQLRSIRACRAVIAVSRNVEDRALRRGVPRERLHMIPNAYTAEPMLSREDARQALHISTPEFRLAWIGRLQEEKGPDVMIEAMGALRHLPVTLSFLGDGPARDMLQQRAMALGIADRITWHGMVPRSVRVLAAFDACVLSSRTEGTPMVLLEAMAANLPIISTAVGGVPDMLDHTEALLVPSENPAALADAIRSTMSHPDGARMRAALAHERLRRDFGETAWLDRHDALYAAITSRPARTSF